MASVWCGGPNDFAWLKPDGAADQTISHGSRCACAHRRCKRKRGRRTHRRPRVCCYGGGGEIRTLETDEPPNGFQDRRIQPLCHSSERKLSYPKPTPYASALYTAAIGMTNGCLSWRVVPSLRQRLAMTCTLAWSSSHSSRACAQCARSARGRRPRSQNRLAGRPFKLRMQAGPGHAVGRG